MGENVRYFPNRAWASEIVRDGALFFLFPFEASDASLASGMAAATCAADQPPTCVWFPITEQPRSPPGCVWQRCARPSNPAQMVPQDNRLMALAAAASLPPPVMVSGAPPTAHGNSRTPGVYGYNLAAVSDMPPRLDDMAVGAVRRRVDCEASLEAVHPTQTKKAREACRIHSPPAKKSRLVPAVGANSLFVAPSEQRCEGPPTTPRLLAVPMVATYAGTPATSHQAKSFQRKFKKSDRTIWRTTVLL